MSVVRDPGRRFDPHVPVLIVGAGACGLVAALAAREAGADVLAVERDATPAGSTALSSGFIPAAYTLFADGGASCGLSGAHVWGYLSGNGFLSAITLGRLAGQSSAEIAWLHHH